MTDRISDLHMSNRRERRLPYITGVVTAAITLLLIEIFNGPELLRGLALFSLLELILLGLITNFWLISIHAASITAAAVITTLVFGPITGSLLIPLMLIVGLVRLYLRRHTLAQVVAGTLLGAAIVAMLSLAGYFA